jgi:hypothetical protein
VGERGLQIIGAAAVIDGIAYELVAPRCRRELRIMDAAGSVLNQGQEKQRIER